MCVILKHVLSGLLCWLHGNRNFLIIIVNTRCSRSCLYHGIDKSNKDFCFYSIDQVSGVGRGVRLATQPQQSTCDWSSLLCGHVHIIPCEWEQGSACSFAFKICRFNTHFHVTFLHFLCASYFLILLQKEIHVYF